MIGEQCAAYAGYVFATTTETNDDTGITSVYRYIADVLTGTE